MVRTPCDVTVSHVLMKKLRAMAARIAVMSYALGKGTGPLRGVRVVEVAGIGPGPHGATILADLGADVIRLERPGGTMVAGTGAVDLLTRGRPSVAIDLKAPGASGVVLDLVGSADVLVEGMRPGTAERLGIGPEPCLARNPRLVYARMTGWGQDGPLASAAGHDLNYIALAGALHGMGQSAERPHFPANLVGDFGGGSTYLVIGILAALLEAQRSGLGQVVDAAIVDGTAHLSAMYAGMLAGGAAQERRTSNLVDGGAPFYDVYETADGKHMSVGALEPQFYDALVEGLGLAGEVPDRHDLASWAELRAAFTARFKEKTQAEWTEVFEGTDACCAPVLPLTEAARHPHLATRGTYVERDGVLQPAPAPRFSRTAATLGAGPTGPGAQSREALAAWGIDGVDVLVEAGVVVQA